MLPCRSILCTLDVSDHHMGGPSVAEWNPGETSDTNKRVHMKYRGSCASTDRVSIQTQCKYYTQCARYSSHHDGGRVSLRSPKLTNRLKSEKVRLVWSERVVESDPPDCAVAMGGDDRAARMLSPVAP